MFRKVVNVTSISGTQGNVGQANYSTAKAGLVGLTKTLAREWGPFKVNVNAVAFGFVETRLTASPEEAGTFEHGDARSRSESRQRCASWRRDHPARTAGDAAGGGRADLLPLLTVVELRPRPGDHRERRPDDGDDVVSFAATIASTRSAARRRAPLRRHGRGVAGVRRTRPTTLRRGAAPPVFAILPVWETIAPASRVGRLRRGAGSASCTTSRTWSCTVRSRSG